jgi:salicylate hydroxylase
VSVTFGARGGISFPCLITTRNAYTGKVLSITQNPENSAAHHRGAIRARRTRLQSALLAKVPDGVIQYSKKLVSLEDLPGRGVRLLFQDRTDVVADIVVGADGIHSVCGTSFLWFGLYA